MSEFETVLRGQVDRAAETLQAAIRADQDVEIHHHTSRIRDLLDLAERHGIETGDWVDRRILEAPHTDD